MTSFDEYVDQYGFHINKKLYDFAVSMMTDRNGVQAQPKSKEAVDSFLSQNGIKLKNNVGWDAPYVLAMAKSDYYGSSITDDAHLAKFVMDYLDDPDGSESKAFDHLVVDCRAKGIVIFWSELM